MLVVTLVNAYLSANVLLGLIFLLVGGLASLSGVLPKAVRYRHLLAFSYVLTLGALALPLAAAWLGHAEAGPHVAQIWSAPTMRDWPALAAGGARSSLVLVHTQTSLPLNVALTIALFAVVLGAVILAVRVGQDLATVRRIIAPSSCVRRYRNLIILASDAVAVPFSFWLPGRYYVVMPSGLIAQPLDFALALRHETQHHRQHDTKWLYLYQALRAFFFWNPAAHWLERFVLDLQEFACDEAMAGHRRLSPQAYCRCLVAVAETALRPHRPLVGTASMARGAARKTLRRRVEVMLKRPKTYGSSGVVLAAGTVSLALMVGAAYASTAVVHDRRVTIADAGRMAEVANRDGDFPVVVNDLILEQLNRFLGTPDGRSSMKAGVARLQSYKELVNRKVTEYRLPLALLAVPLVESRYRNAAQDGNPDHGAGLWMFMAETARNYGLKVDGDGDARLDVEAETDAAMRLLGGLDLQFKDWRLALLAYNGGSGLVEKAIRETGSRDVWDLVRAGYENDPHYVAEVMAAVLILKNPGVLE